MRLKVISSVEDVVARQLCCGCGACAAIDPETLEMVDDLDHGRRPCRRGEDGSGRAPAPETLAVCPGVGLEHPGGPRDRALIGSLRAAWGPVRAVWEGHAADPDLRFSASSGGAATAIALAGIERLGLHGLLHIRARPDAPLLNETVLSTNRNEVLDAVGSRYAPASPCDGLGLVEDASGPCVFIGKPCDAAAAARVAALRPTLREKLAVTIAIFCAGTPTTRGTMAILERLGVDDPRDVTAIRYRGKGWPGPTSVTVRTASGFETRELDYETAWGDVLTRHKQWRCQVCADHTGEFADISVGDAWHRPVGDDEPGRSLVLARTERGRRYVEDAIRLGYLDLRPADPSVVAQSQPGLLLARGAVWGRVATCRVLGVPAPRYRRLPMLRTWLTRLSLRDRLRSIVGTARRIVRRGLRDEITLNPIRERETTKRAA
jgi:coenzyme F420 hydrogenase subunit beta